MKKSLIIILCLIFTFSLFGCGEKAKDTLTVGFDQEFPPMGFVDNDGKFVGFDLDLATEAAKRLGMEVKFQPIDWNSKDMELDSGNIDCIWNGFTISGRENDYEWTTPYMNNRQIVVVMKDSSYQTLADLSGKNVALQLDSSAEAALSSNVEFANSVTATLTDTNLNALMNLESGAVDAVVMDEIVARYNIEKQGGKYRILDEELASEVFGVGFKLGNTELRDKIQVTLEEMNADGTLARISNEWFGKDITTIGK